MITLSTILKHYKKKDIQDALVEHARDREVAVRYGDSFGARPDILQYGADVFEFAQKGATSFHCSEERWLSPLQLKPSMRQREMEELRCGWDLVLDVDCKDWEYAKLITMLLIKLIRSFGITAVTVKFSGNKGFHIGVPFEAFPKKVHGKDIQTLFPEGPRRIAQYLIHLLEERFLELTKGDIKINAEELTLRTCVFCGMKHTTVAERFEFICANCDSRKILDVDEKYLSCEKCSKLMEKHVLNPNVCVRCGKREFSLKLDATRIMEIDTLLISSRHLYRAPYSLHEKSGLCSIPIDPDSVMAFDKTAAYPDKVVTMIAFLPRVAVPDEASHLFLQAFDFTAVSKEPEKELKEIEIPATAIAASCFPPCIQKISAGLEDGRKRAVFILINFLRSCGWSNEQVAQYVNEWNLRNPQPLRENYVIGQLSYARKNRPILPPNCSNLSYYSSLGIKCDEGICSKCKNPAMYAKRRARYAKPAMAKVDKNDEAIRKEDISTTK